MWSRIRITSRAVLLGMAFALCLGLTQMGSALPAAKQAASTKKDVYVCDCMGNKSCPCMTVAKKEGKCVCGKEMKAVAADSAWAKHNLRELSR